MAFSLEFTEGATTELGEIKLFESRKIMAAIEKNLVHQPTTTTKNRKPLASAPSKFHHEPPLWELRVGEFRVFYDVNKAFETVYIRAIRRKSPKQRTKDILQ